MLYTESLQTNVLLYGLGEGLLSTDIEDNIYQKVFIESVHSNLDAKNKFEAILNFGSRSSSS